MLRCLWLKGLMFRWSYFTIKSKITYYYVHNNYRTNWLISNWLFVVHIFSQNIEQVRWYCMLWIAKKCFNISGCISNCSVSSALSRIVAAHHTSTYLNQEIFSLEGSSLKFQIPFIKWYNSTSVCTCKTYCALFQGTCYHGNQIDTFLKHDGFSSYYSADKYIFCSIILRKKSTEFGKPIFIFSNLCLTLARFAQALKSPWTWFQPSKYLN